MRGTQRQAARSWGCARSRCHRSCSEKAYKERRFTPVEDLLVVPLSNRFCTAHFKCAGAKERINQRVLSAENCQRLRRACLFPISRLPKKTSHKGHAARIFSLEAPPTQEIDPRPLRTPNSAIRRSGGDTVLRSDPDFC